MPSPQPSPLTQLDRAEASCRSGRLRRFVLGAALVAAALSATGCLQGEVDVTVRDDRSGSVAVEVLANDQVQQALGNADLDQVITGAFAGRDGVELESFERDGQPGYRLVVPFEDYRTFSDVLTAGAQVGGQQVTLFSSFRLTELSSGGWEMAATVNPAGSIVSGAQVDAIDQLLAAVDGEPGGGLRLTVALPGEVVSSNATSVDGGSATWRLDDPDTPTELQMRTTPSQFLSPVLVVVLGALGVVIIGLVLALSMSGRKYRSRPGRARRRSERRQDVGTSAWAPQQAAAPKPASARVDELPSLAETESAPPVGPDGSPPAGWYTDPDPDGGGRRWWDGTDWTDDRRD